MIKRHGCLKQPTALACLLLLALAACGTSGCMLVTAPTRLLHDFAEYNEGCDGVFLGWRNHVWAHQAWRAHVAQCGDHPYQCDFGRGFRQGYTDVASGGNGCPPMLPPRRYWSWRYQSPEGQAKVAAWFEGYPLGASAAQRDGVGGWSQLQMSPTAEAIYATHAAAERFRAWRPPGAAAEELYVPSPNPLLPELDPAIGPPPSEEPATPLPDNETRWPAGQALPPDRQTLREPQGRGTQATAPRPLTDARRQGLPLVRHLPPTAGEAPPYPVVQARFEPRQPARHELAPRGGPAPRHEWPSAGASDVSY